MEHKGLRSLLSGAKHFRDRQNYAIHQRLVYHQSSEGDSRYSSEGDNLPPEWYEKAFRKLTKWSHSLNAVDLIGGRLVNVSDHSRVVDDKLEQKMHAFKYVSRVFIGLPTIHETMKKNMMASSPKSTQCASSIQCFSKKHEREALCINSLTKVSDILGISAQQRKVVRQTICPQVTQHQIWTGALMEILNELKSEIDVLIDRRPSREMIFGQQIITCCLKLLKPATAYDPEVTSWMRLTPLKGAESTDPPKWQDVLDMSTDLINYLCNEKELAHHVTKIEIMKEGLYQIRDVLIDKNIGYRETRYQEHLVNKKLTKALGYSSQCLFTLLVYYLYGSVGDIEVDVRGGLHRAGEFRLYMGKLLTLDENEVVWNGVRQLDKALGLFKFVWETAGMKGDLELQGHLWSCGAENRSLTYRGNIYFLHGISL